MPKELFNKYFIKCLENEWFREISKDIPEVIVENLPEGVLAGIPKFSIINNFHSRFDMHVHNSVCDF